MLTNFCRIIAAVNMVEKERSRRLGTSILNQVVQEALAFKPPPRTRGGKRGRIYFSTQVHFVENDKTIYKIISQLLRWIWFASVQPCSVERVPYENGSYLLAYLLKPFFFRTFLLYKALFCRES